MSYTHYPGLFDLRLGASPRTPGIHLSGIIRAIAQRIGELKMDTGEAPLKEALRGQHHGEHDLHMRFAVGFAWEEWICHQIRHEVEAMGGELLHQPGEYALDGIVGTPDAVELRPDNQVVVHECKATWMSSNKQLLWIYIAQVQAYCWLAGSTKASVHVLHVNGDYKGMAPRYYRHDLEWERDEIEAAWRNIVAHKHLAVPEE